MKCDRGCGKDALYFYKVSVVVKSLAKAIAFCEDHRVMEHEARSAVLPEITQDEYTIILVMES